MVSIIMPLYNSELFIKDAIDSVINQIYKDWELLIIDDCSTDSSPDLVKEYCKKNPNIFYYRLDKNSGTAVARNFGIELAKGCFVTFLDSDDLWDKDFLIKQVEFINNNGPIVTASYRRMTANSLSDFIVPSNITYDLLLNGNPISCLTTIYDKRVFPNARFPENLRKCEDYAFWLNLLHSGYQVIGNKEVLATYRIVENSKSRNKFSLIKYMFDVYYRNQKLNIFSSCYHILRWAFYGLKKYSKVR